MDTPSGNGAFRDGPGQFEHPDDASERVHAWREAFLAVIAEEASDVLQSLAINVLPSFQPVWNQHHSDATARGYETIPYLSWTGDLKWSALVSASTDDTDDTADTARQALREALELWAQHWNLDESDDDWILSRALHTMEYWCQFPHLVECATAEATGNTRICEHLAWSPRIVMTTVELTRDETTLTLPRFAWYPQQEDLSQARQRIQAEAKEAITAELARIETLAKSRGLKPTKQLRRGRVHCQWLVAYQVRELNWEDIAQRFNQQDSDSVRKTARDTAKEVGITLREGNPTGRPRGTRQSHNTRH